ncbi:uncharacterized protein LOC116252953 [Nymphaea colorata]|nr:uncharacterized protein LOC116252953 [Nymphaea colorata]
MAAGIASMCMPDLARSRLLTVTSLKSPPCISFRLLKDPASRGLLSCSTSLLQFQNLSYTAPRAINSALGPMEGPEKFNFSQAADAAKNLWEGCPQPVKIFPWKKALVSYLNLIFGLVYGVVKYLSIPLLAISSLSEMSYCAHEKKMKLIPIPLLAGAVMAGILKNSMVEASQDLEGGDFPWHLLAIAVFFLFLKLLGPYYPYWGRIFIPHFANGGLWRVLWFTFIWYRQPRESSKRMDISLGNNQSL